MAGYRIEKPRLRRDDGPRLKERELSVDRVLLAVAVSLALFGAVMVYSASAVLAQKAKGDEFYFLVRQSAWVTLGLVAMVAAMLIDYRRYKSSAFISTALVITFALLIAVFFFPKVNHAHRWIRYGGLLSLQPSEIAKLTLAVFLAYFFERRANEVTDFKNTVLPASAVAAGIIGLVALESDLGTALVIGVIFAAILYYAGVRARHLLGLAAAAAPAVTCMIVFVGWRMQRIFAFLDPWSDTDGASYQVVQSMIAIGSGGTSGLGFAQSRQKMFFLPAAHSDFIFAIIGEELGLLGAATVVLLFGVLAWRGFRAARSAPDMFGQLLSVGITVMLVVQACFNISVTLSLVPNKGIPLPFISSGGSSVAISLLAVGILLNISKHGRLNEGGARLRAARGLRFEN